MIGFVVPAVTDLHTPTLRVSREGALIVFGSATLRLLGDVTWEPM